MREFKKDPEYFVFSSHKTGTQTLVSALRGSGREAIHLHSLKHLSATADSFRAYLSSYLEKYGHKVKIISIFRLPIERHISSFFQSYGDAFRRYMPLCTIDDTVVNRLDLAGLNALFLFEVASGRLVGYKESLHELLGALKIDSASMCNRSHSSSLAINHELAEVSLFEFSALFRHGLTFAGSSLGISFESCCAYNMSVDKWYSAKYHDFKGYVSIPADIVHRTFFYRKDLIDLFFPGQYSALAEAACRAYSRSRLKA
jgi:hypothetical protein